MENYTNLKLVIKLSKAAGEKFNIKKSTGCLSTRAVLSASREASALGACSLVWWWRWGEAQWSTHAWCCPGEQLLWFSWEPGQLRESSLDLKLLFPVSPHDGHSHVTLMLLPPSHFDSRGCPHQRLNRESLDSELPKLWVHQILPFIKYLSSGICYSNGKVTDITLKIKLIITLVVV